LALIFQLLKKGKEKVTMRRYIITDKDILMFSALDKPSPEKPEDAYQLHS
jgi:hypothetical protein